MGCSFTAGQAISLLYAHKNDDKIYYMRLKELRMSPWQQWKQMPRFSKRFKCYEKIPNSHMYQ